MAGYDLDRYRDLEGVKGVQRVLERAHVVLEPIHREPPPPAEEPSDKPRANVQLTTKVIAAAPPPEEKKKAGRAHVERQMVVMGRPEPKRSKPFTMSDLRS